MACQSWMSVAARAVGTAPTSHAAASTTSLRNILARTGISPWNGRQNAVSSAREARGSAATAGATAAPSLPGQMLDLVAHEVADTFAAIAQEAQQPGIDEVGEQDAVAGRDLGPDRIGRMPRVVA